MPNLVEPDTQFRDHFVDFRVAKTVNTIPYDEAIPQKPAKETPLGNHSSKKVTVVGMGQVGLGCVVAILNQDICGTLALVDIAAKKLEGEAKDFQQGSAFHQHTTILASDTYDVSENSDMVVITAGVAQQPGESRLSLVDRNANIMKKIMPQVLKYSPNATILIVSNPCDIMTAIAAKLAGPDFPQGKVFGAGTCLDSSRFQTLIAQSIDLDPKNVHGYIIGEHGDSSIPVWSSVRVGALPLLEPGEEPNETLKKIHKSVVNSAYDIISLKGYTNWAIGMSTAHICKAVLNDTRTIIPVSTCVRGLYDVEGDVFLSLPCSLSSQGVQRVAVLPLTDSEKATFQKCAKGIWEVQKPIWENLLPPKEVKAEPAEPKSEG
ncbi:LDHB [Symbiodinium natans]|uniref:L-lactate dehydrogenase n=1 Tax=Symbiodinium natans TaxID=878477 RepID=A0A812IEH3_9DINO|nr:LDHB [Symbiodinium natans]